MNNDDVDGDGLCDLEDLCTNTAACNYDFSAGYANESCQVSGGNQVETYPVEIAWFASDMNHNVGLRTIPCTLDSILYPSALSAALYDTLQIPFGAAASLSLQSAGGLENGFFNSTDPFTVDVTSSPEEEFSFTDNQKAPEYLHYSQLVDKTVSGAGTFVVYTASRNQSTSLFDTWRWSGLHNASPRWAIPTAVAIGHKIASAATHSGVDNVRALTHSSSSNAYGNGNYNDPGSNYGVGCAGCGVLTGTNNLRGNHSTTPQTNMEWFRSDNNDAMTSTGWYGTPATGSFNSIMNYYGHPTFGSANVTGVTTQTVFLPPANDTENNGQWFLQVKQQSWTNPYSTSSGVTGEICQFFPNVPMLGNVWMCSTGWYWPEDGADAPSYSGGTRNGMEANTHIGLNMYSNSSGASGWSGNGQWSWNRTRPFNNNDQNWLTFNYLSSSARNTLTSSVRYLGNNFVRSKCGSIAGGAQNNYANRTHCAATGSNLDCGINTVTSYHRAKGELLVTPAKGRRPFAMVYDDGGMVGHSSGTGGWPPDVWVTQAATAAENGAAVTASIDGDMCEDVRLGLSVDLVNELSNQALQMKLYHWSLAKGNWSKIKQYDFYSEAGLQTIDDDVCASTFGGPLVDAGASGMYPLNLAGNKSDLFRLEITDLSDDGQTYMNEWSLSFEEMSSEFDCGAFPSVANLEGAQYGEDFFITVEEITNVTDSIWDLKVHYTLENTEYVASLSKPNYDGIWEVNSNADLAGIIWAGDAGEWKVSYKHKTPSQGLSASTSRDLKLQFWRSNIAFDCSVVDAIAPFGVRVKTAVRGYTAFDCIADSLEIVREPLYSSFDRIDQTINTPKLSKPSRPSGNHNDEEESGGAPSFAKTIV